MKNRFDESGGELLDLVPLFVVRELNAPQATARAPTRSARAIGNRLFGWIVVLLFSFGVGSARAHAPEPQRPAGSQSTPKSAPAQPPEEQASPAPKSAPTATESPAPASSPAAAETKTAPTSSPDATDSKTAPPSSPTAGDRPKTIDPTADAGDRSKTIDPTADAGALTRKSEVHGERIDGLQVEVDELKDKIFRSKARLALLRETVLRGVLAGSRLVLAHRNLMGSSFRLVRIVFILDGAQIYARTDETGTLDQEDELVVYDGNIPPGDHELAVELTYKGHGIGRFSYLAGYTFESRSTHRFTAPENGALKLNAIGFERGNLTTEMRDRPSVDWQLVPLDATGRPQPSSARRRASQ